VNDLEAVKLARYVRAICPQQKFDEYTADTWYDLLRDYDFDACKQAAITIGRRQPFIAPAEIIEEVRAARQGALQEFQYEPDPDETPLEFLARLRSQIADVLDGQRPPVLAVVGAPRPVAELTSAVGREVPEGWERPATRIWTALDVRCSYCQAPARRPCKSSRGRKLGHYHPSRIDAAKGL
jgi:hypothetical protein